MNRLEFKKFDFKTTDARVALLALALTGGCVGNIYYTGIATGGGGAAAGAGAGVNGQPGGGAGNAIGDPALGGSGVGVDPGAGTGGGVGAAGAGTGAGGTTTVGGTGGQSPAAAVPGTLSRLTATQYNTTLHDLFAPVAIPDQILPADITVEGFDNNSAAQTPSATLIEAYRTSAVAVVTSAMTTPSTLLGCSPKTPADETTCANSALSGFAKKAFRHPVTATELTNLLKFYNAARSGGADFPTAMSLTLEAILQSPSFLYRVELGSAIAGRPGIMQLTPYEMASRLSYLLWNTMPDDALFASAAAGELASVAGLETQARRLLAQPRAHAAVLNFHSQWLRFDKMNNLVKSTTAFPGFNATMAAAMRQSAEKYVDGIFFGDGTLTALLTDNHAWVNNLIAPLYGVAAPSGATLALVPVDSTQRSGILTNVGLLAGFAHETTDSPVLRGVFVLDRLMCGAPPPPPATANTTPPAAGTGAPQTTRQRFATQHEQGTCAGCHRIIDGIGFGFEHYDAIGQWRATDSGLPVDSSGWFSPNSPDLVGTFDGAVDLGKRLAASPSVQACVASQWMRYALGVDHTGLDAGAIGPLVGAFAQNSLNMRELLIALVKSDAFRMRATGL